MEYETTHVHEVCFFHGPTLLGTTVPIPASLVKRFLIHLSMYYLSLAGLIPKPDELKSLTDWRAESHWPNASSKIRSGQKTSRAIEDNLRHSI